MSFLKKMRKTGKKTQATGPRKKDTDEKLKGDVAVYLKEIKDYKGIS